MVNVGEQAPDFALKDQNDNVVKLSNYRGKKVLLAFFPFAFSPVCTDEMGCFELDLIDIQEKKIKVMGISVDSTWTLKAFAEKLEVTFPLLSDFSKEASKSYGVLRPEGFANRAYFLIDEKGKVIYAKIMDNPGTKLDNDEILKAVKR